MSIWYAETWGIRRYVETWCVFPLIMQSLDQTSPQDLKRKPFRAKPALASHDM